MKNNIQKNVMVNVDELTRLATYGGNDGGVTSIKPQPEPRVAVSIGVSIIVVSVLSIKGCS